jgi:hypothetical protein
VFVRRIIAVSVTVDEEAAVATKFRRSIGRGGLNPSTMECVCLARF